MPSPATRTTVSASTRQELRRIITVAVEAAVMADVRQRWANFAGEISIGPKDELFMGLNSCGEDAYEHAVRRAMPLLKARIAWNVERRLEQVIAELSDAAYLIAQVENDEDDDLGADDDDEDDDEDQGEDDEDEDLPNVQNRGVRRAQCRPRKGNSRPAHRR